MRDSARLPRAGEQAELSANSAQKGKRASACSSNAWLGRRLLSCEQLIGRLHRPPAARLVANAASRRVSRRALKASHRGLEHMIWSKSVFPGQRRPLWQRKHGSKAAFMVQDDCSET